MAIGGTHNKGNNSISNGGNSNRSSSGRSYGMMIVLAFGAALLGVMILHKLRERRIYTLIVKQKDRDFYSLHLVLQKEREYNQDVTRKNEEMKAKMYALRTQKMELDRRVLEMQSTIASLKDQLKTMQVALEEKRNETIMLRAQQDDQMANNERESKNGPQVVALVETLKQKEAEISDLKRRLEFLEKDSSGSSPSLNVTAEEQKGKSDEDGEKSVGQDENDGDEVGQGDRREMIGRRVEKIEKAEDENGKDDGVSGVVENVKNEDAIDETSSTGGEENSIANSTKKDIDDFQDEGDEAHETAKDRTKLDDQEGGANDDWSKARRKRAFVGNKKGKRLISIANNGTLENNGSSNGVAARRSVRLHENGGGRLRTRHKKRSSNRQVPLVTESNGQLEDRKAENYSGVEALDRREESNKVRRSHRNLTGRVQKRDEQGQMYGNEGSKDHKASNLQGLENREGDDKFGDNSEERNSE